MNNHMLPQTIYTGKWRGGHIQGIAIDRERRYLYCSFTTELVKLDMKGNVIGSVKGFTGHLGCLAYNAEDGRIWASLEYKNDFIGRGILDRLGIENEIKNAFYVAIFDGEKITRPNMDAEKDGVMTTVWLREPTEDYLATWEEDGVKKEQRHGCSGIDGITFAPAFHGTGMRLLVAYGVYGDLSRSDNDYQVLLSYDPAALAPYETVLSADNIHTSGPAHCENRYFVFTGNTNFGVQNLEYDAFTGDIFMAVYRGHKEQYPNYSLFVIDGSVPPRTETLLGCGGETGEVLSLKEAGLSDGQYGIYGYNFKYGSTGMFSLGDGQFYFSEDHGEGGEFESTIRLYRYTGAVPAPFVKSEDADTRE